MRATPPPDISPAEFFTRWLPRVVQQDEERRDQLGTTRATIVFELEGEGEAEDSGVFHVRIADGAVQGGAGEPEHADLRVRVDVPTWRALNAGTLSAPRAFLQRRVHLSGNLLLAVKLHLIIG
jgi:putative sterol carrier protein